VPHRHRNVVRFTAARRLSLLMIMGLLTTVPATSASAETRADAQQGGIAALALGSHWGGGSQHNGNGTNNRISSPFNSPNFNRGIQHVINANSGGKTVIQSGLCKKKIFCKISQRADP
jgi:hypothetical protein